jgi:beta-glucosidase
VPIGTLLACTWNHELNHQLFHLIGQELRAYQIDTLLGPGINIHRHPLNGRNFEYFSEDPLITGTMAAAQTAGLRDAGVSGTIKHFAANDQETARHDADSVVSERALREIHLKGFEMAVRDGGASSIMTAYNPINGHWTASNYDLNTTVLRGEWGYTGIVMTDWWAKMNDTTAGGEATRTQTACMVRAQNDLYMVVENDGAERNAADDDTLAALAAGTLTIGELQRAAMNICRFLLATPAMARPVVPYDPVKTFAAAPQPANRDTVSAADVQLDTSINTEVLIDVAAAGVYTVTAQVRYARDKAAQSACSLYLNGTFAMTLSTNGTDGEQVTIEGVPVRLAPGCYALALDFVKPGMALGALTFAEA